MELSPVELIPSMLAAIAALAAFVAARVARAGSGPRLAAKVADCETRLAAAELTVANQRTAWTAFQAELAGLLEAIEDQVEVVEHKRRRTAAAASKLKPPEEPADVLGELRRRARNSGLPV